MPLLILRHSMSSPTAQQTKTKQVLNKYKTSAAFKPGAIYTNIKHMFYLFYAGFDMR